jgi:hypothetical protein
MSTYNLGRFLGPGLPRGFGRPSAVKAGPALLFAPFFLGPSVGGGIRDGRGVPFATGVFDVDFGGSSPFELPATGMAFEVVDGGSSFKGDSSFTTGLGSNLWSS